MPACPECNRPLLVSDGFEMCCHYDCSEFGMPVDQQPPEPPSQPLSSQQTYGEKVTQR